MSVLCKTKIKIKIYLYDFTQGVQKKLILQKINKFLKRQELLRLENTAKNR